MPKSNNTVTRASVLERYFPGIENAEDELQNTLTAMGLKPKGNSFTLETAYKIHKCRGWIDSHEITDYNQLKAKYEAEKDAIAEEFKQQESALVQAEQNGSMVNNNATYGERVELIAAPVQQSYAEGLEVIQGANQRIQYNKALATNLIDGAFWQGVQDGVEGESQGELSADQLPTQEETQNVLNQVLGKVRTSHKRNTSN